MLCIRITYLWTHTHYAITQSRTPCALCDLCHLLFSVWLVEMDLKLLKRLKVMSCLNLVVWLTFGFFGCGMGESSGETVIKFTDPAFCTKNQSFSPTRLSCVKCSWDTSSGSGALASIDSSSSRTSESIIFVTSTPQLWVAICLCGYIICTITICSNGN